MLTVKLMAIIFLLSFKNYLENAKKKKKKRQQINMKTKGLLPNNQIIFMRRT